jgi:hypothetical protein
VLHWRRTAKKIFSHRFSFTIKVCDLSNIITTNKLASTNKRRDIFLTQGLVPCTSIREINVQFPTIKKCARLPTFYTIFDSLILYMHLIFTGLLAAYLPYMHIFFHLRFARLAKPDYFNCILCMCICARCRRILRALRCDYIYVHVTYFSLCPSLQGVLRASGRPVEFSLPVKKQRLVSQETGGEDSDDNKYRLFIEQMSPVLLPQREFGQDDGIRAESRDFPQQVLKLHLQRCLIFSLFTFCCHLFIRTTLFAVTMAASICCHSNPVIHCHLACLQRFALLLSSPTVILRLIILPNNHTTFTCEQQILNLDGTIREISNDHRNLIYRFMIRIFSS